MYALDFVNKCLLFFYEMNKKTINSHCVFVFLLNKMPIALFSMILGKAEKSEIDND